MRLVSTLCLAATVAMLAPAASARPIAYESFKQGRNYFHVVKADMNSNRVRAQVAHYPGLVTPGQLLRPIQPTAAITGTFFSPTSGYPIADVLVHGQLVARGNRGSVVGVLPSGQVIIRDAQYSRRFDWNEYQCGLRGAIRVVTKGVVHPNPKAQQFRDRRIWGKAQRTGVGITQHNKLVMIVTPSAVTLSEFGRAMVHAGVREGVALDGGSSTCLYYRGSMVVGAGRKISNMLVISEVPPDLIASHDDSFSR
jgi:hypothetical protein